MTLRAFGATDVGKNRHNNEDDFIVREDLVLFAVADGVGGAAAGEVASHIFIKSCESEFEAAIDNPLDMEDLIRRCFVTANSNIINYTRANTDAEGMGCTAELLSVRGDNYYIGHVGDSRCYLIRNHSIQQLTKDHSLIQEQIDQGLVDAHTAQQHWLRNSIYRAVGHISAEEVDVLSGRCQQGDVFLLCSDGLSDMVSELGILRVADNPKLDLKERAKNLIAEANDMGGQDNITVVLVEYQARGEEGFLRKLFPKS